MGIPESGKDVKKPCLASGARSLAALWEYDLAIIPGVQVLAGVDEAGRGPLAGDVVAACVVLDFEKAPILVDDSKKLSEKRREALFDEIMAGARFVGVGSCSPAEIDGMNILAASLLAMKRAVAASGCRPDLVLVDGNQRIREFPFPQQTLIKGDGVSASIAAASIIAKVTRDRRMMALHASYPQYLFSLNKGYGSKAHLDAIRSHGFSPIHRKSFRPRSLFQTNLFETE